MKPRAIALLVTISLATCNRSSWATRFKQEIPKADLTLSSTHLPAMTLQLTLSINQRATQDIVTVHYQNGHYLLPWAVMKQTPIAEQLRQYVINHFVTIDTIPDITVNYLAPQQQLALTVPTDWLPRQQFTQQADNLTRQPAQSDNGLVINYDLYSNYYQKNWEHALWSEAKLFSQLGNISHSGLLRYGNQQPLHYQRNDTQWNYNDEANTISYYLGDVITASLPWSNSVRVGGLQISRNFTLRPDLITYPLPEFSGQARLPSTLDLYINHYKANTVTAAPGPFTLSAMPYVTGANQAVLTITEPNGYTTQQTFAFYAANNLLHTGLSDFSFTTGWLRNSQTGQISDYHNWVASGFFRYGLTNWLTVNGRAEGGADLLTTGMGMDWRVGLLGVISGAINHSHANAQAFLSPTKSTLSPAQQGQQWSLAYNYSQPYFNVNLQHTARNDGYADLARYKNNYQLNNAEDQIMLGLNLNSWGSLSSAYISQRNHHNHIKMISFSYSKSIQKNSLIIALTRDLHKQDNRLALQWIMSLSDLSSLGTNVDYSNNTVSPTINYSKALPSDGGLGWNINYSPSFNHNSDTHQLGINWKTDHFTASLGNYGDQETTSWAQFSGAIVNIGNHLYLSNQINDAFALVSTEGYADIPIKYENQVMGKSNADGLFLIPSVVAYYPGKYAIDATKLPSDATINTSEQTRAIKKNSGSLITFPIKQNSSASLTLIDNQHRPLAAGSIVENLADHQTTLVGWDGFLYLPSLTTNSQFKVTTTNGTTCYFQLNVSQLTGIHHLGKTLCQSPQEK